jgi:hypothetical protein
LSDHDANEKTLTDSSYNQQATNAVLSLLNIHPKPRSATNQQPIPWNGSSNVSNTSLQDIQRQQQIQNESRQQQQQHITSGHSSTSTPAWGNNFQQTSSAFFWDNQHSSSSNQPTSTTTNTKPITPWTELKPTSPSTVPSGKANETTKNEREAKRTQDALSKWTQAQFKDDSQDIDVPTLVQLLKDIDNPGEIMEYVQPYIGSVSKAKEFANDFLAKRNQLANAEVD